MLCVNCMQFHVTLKCNMYVHDLSRMCRARIQQKGLSPVADGSASCWSWTCDLGLQPWALGFALTVLSSNQICLPFSFLSYFAALLILTASFFCFLVSFFWNKKTQYLIQKRFVFILLVILRLPNISYEKGFFFFVPFPWLWFWQCSTVSSQSEDCLPILLQSHPRRGRQPTSISQDKSLLPWSHSVNGNLVMYSISANDVT